MYDLSFPADQYEMKQKLVKTRKGDVCVAYRQYKNIVYAADPVLEEFQSMHVEVPIRINGKDVETENAPILIAVRIGAYMATRCGGERLGFMMPKPPEDEAEKNGISQGEGSVKKKKMGPPAPLKEDDRIPDLSLAAGWVLVRPGNRGRGLKAEDGSWLGKAPAAIVDLKAVVRYLRHNRGIVPGDTEHIISHGLSAGGALSALLGASGNSPLYEPYLKEIGAAEERDDIFASADFCPMCDLEHADIAYEWMYGSFENQRDGLKVDQVISGRMAKAFADYQSGLGFTRSDTGEPLTAENYKEYLEKRYLIPSANEYLHKLEPKQREDYLLEHPWIRWDGNSAFFTVDELHEDTGRLKDLPAFDSPRKSGECEIFGTPSQYGENFTSFYRKACGESGACVSELVKHQTQLMNPMTFICDDNPGCAEHWWIRLGTRDNGMSFSIAGNLAAGLEKLGKDVNLKFYWDAGHYMDLDPEDFVEWINRIILEDNRGRDT